MGTPSTAIAAPDGSERTSSRNSGLDAACICSRTPISATATAAAPTMTRGLARTHATADAWGTATGVRRTPSGTTVLAFGRTCDWTASVDAPGSADLTGVIAVTCEGSSDRVPADVLVVVSDDGREWPVDRAGTSSVGASTACGDGVRAEDVLAVTIVRSLSCCSAYRARRRSLPKSSACAYRAAMSFCSAVSTARTTSGDKPGTR